MYFGKYKIMSLHLKSLDVEKNKQILRDKLEEFKTILKSLQTTLQIHNWKIIHFVLNNLIKIVDKSDWFLSYLTWFKSN